MQHVYMYCCQNNDRIVGSVMFVCTNLFFFFSKWDLLAQWFSLPTLNPITYFINPEAHHCNKCIHGGKYLNKMGKKELFSLITTLIYNSQHKTAIIYTLQIWYNTFYYTVIFGHYWCRTLKLSWKNRVWMCTTNNQR